MEIFKLLIGLNNNNSTGAGLITPIAVGFIFLTFLIFLFSLLSNIRRLKKRISPLKRSSKEEEFHKAFGALWEDYRGTFVEYSFGKKTHASASEYFNSSHLLQKSCFGLPLLKSASNLLVGLGILGTFLGLTIGIQGFDTSTTDSIKDSIQGLLTGMGSAFLTSVWGMSLSLIMTIFEKSQIGELQVKLYQLCYEIDYNYRFNKEDEFNLRKLELNELFDKYFIYQDENDNKVNVSKLLHDNFMVSDKMCGAIQSFSTDLATKIEVGFEAILNSDSLNEILPSLHALKAEIIKLSSDIKSPATDMIETIVEELKRAVATVMSEMREAMSDASYKDLSDITQLLASSSQALIDLPESLSKMTAELENSFAGMKENIFEASDKAVDQSKEGIKSAHDMMINTALQLGTKFDHITSNITGSLESTQLQVKTSQENQLKINQTQNDSIKTVENLLIELQNSIERLSVVNTNVGTTINETSKLQSDVSNSCNTLAQFSDVIRRSSDNFVTTQQQFKEFSSDFINENIQLIERLQTLVKESTLSTSENINRYSTINVGIESIFEKIHTGLEQYQKTVDDGVKSSLTKYTESLTQVAENLCGASNAHQEMLEDLLDTIEKIKK